MRGTVGASTPTFIYFGKEELSKLGTLYFALSEDTRRCTKRERQMRLIWKCIVYEPAKPHSSASKMRRRQGKVR